MSEAAGLPWRRNLAGQGWGWFVAGITLWARAPLRATLGMAIIGAAWLILALIPVLGALTIAWLTPAVGAGILQAVHDTARDGRPEPRHWLHGFRQPALAGPLLRLGGLFVLAGLGGQLLMLALLATALGVAESPDGPDTGDLVLVSGLFLAWLAYTAVIFLALLFAVPLIQFSGATVWSSVRASFRGTLANLGPLLVVGIIYLPLALIASLPLMLGHLVLIPIMAGTIYAAHRDIFGHRPEAAD